MLFDGQPGDAWGDQPRSNRLVFIGRNLEQESLEQGLRCCKASLMSPTRRPPRTFDVKESQ